MFFREKGEAILAALSGKVISIADVDSPILQARL